MDILFVIPTLRGGGAERSLVELIRGLEGEGVKSNLAVFDLSEAAFLGRLPAGCRLTDLHSGRTRSSVVSVLRIVWKLKPDFLFVTLSHANLMVGLIRVFLPRRTICVAQQVTMISDVSILGSGLRAKVARFFYTLSYRRFDHVVCVSRTVMEDLRNTLHLEPARLSVIHNPIDLEEISAGHDAQSSDDAERFIHTLPPRSIILIAAGSLLFYKGFDILIDALALCEDKSLQVIVLGEGPLRSELELRARQRKVSDQIHFVGFKSDPYRWFTRADWFVLPSRMEGFGNVIIEALACGLPVIATPAGGAVSDVLPYVSGCVVAEDMEPASLARAIRKAVKGGSHTIQRDFLGDFDLPHISQEYLRTLKGISADAHRSVGEPAPA